MAEEQDCLLNRKHRNYVKKGVKDALWEAKAVEMGKTADILKKWYSNMRTRFGKLMKHAPSGSCSPELTERDNWIMQFEFLRPHLVVQVHKRIPVIVSTFPNFMLKMHLTLIVS